ncbi:MAG TPA: L-2-hydroxyglutarate oxidase [Thermoanaerobaculia bacterium]|nr:L-2-hydroxyglutarate oxidase [Thermoanaerobaculia bacterium]
MTYTVAVVGGGLVGLAAARAVQQRLPAARVVVLEKEAAPARHQSGRNSGVLHSGIYYRPGSLKARFARDGNRALRELCARRGLPCEVCGKVILAGDAGEAARLDELAARGAANGVASEPLARDQLAAREPHARGAAALLVPEAGIVDFAAVANALAEEVREAGGEVRTGATVERVGDRRGGLRLATTAGPVEAELLLNCAGLYADRVARLAGVEPAVRIVPFRGEYYRLRPAARQLVRHLLYPVPDPRFPFLGVHLHRGVDGEVGAGPNAVLALAREGYSWGLVDPAELAETLAWPGLWRLAARYPRLAAGEMARSLSPRLFLRSLRRLVPELSRRDLLPAPSGVRAQALGRDGTLLDDFLIAAGERSLHVLNAPSPAATSCLPIGEELARRVEQGL